MSDSRISQLSPHFLSTSPAKTSFKKFDKFGSNPDFHLSFRQLLFGKTHTSYFRILFQMSEDPDFSSYSHNPSKLLSFRLFKKFAKMINLSYNEYIQDPRKIHSMIDALYAFDNSTGVRLGVDFDLYLRTLMNFGTNKHLLFIKKIFSMTDIGCFALGEFAHGSNTRDLMTTAVLDQERDEFILNSGGELGYKFWIGSAKDLANMAVIFAELIINDQNYGVHAFVVPLRHKHSHSLLPGVYIGDCGSKMGLNYKDEGFILLRNVRIPRDNLLDRYSKVSPKGEFVSQMKTLGERFGFLIGTIMNEPRILVCNRTLLNLMNGLTIATRFICSRRQFNRPGESRSKEIRIIEYPLTQFRLFPLLSGCMVLKIAARRLHDSYEELKSIIFDYHNPKIMELHAIISVMKPLTTWFSRNGLMGCREICGGLGFSGLNRLGEIYSDNNVNVVWEGDNYVLLQQTARYILEFARGLKGSAVAKDKEKNLLDFLQNEEEIDFKNRNNIIKDHIRDFMNLNVLEKIFEHRLLYLLKKSGSELNKNIDELPNVFSAWNQTQIYFLKNMSLAFGELFVFKETMKEINNSNYNKDALKTLKIMLCLWSLSIIYENFGDFLHYFTKENLVDIKDVIMDLCAELKDKAVSVVDSFCIPENLLNSPIGSRNQDIYQAFLGKLNQQRPSI